MSEPARSAPRTAAALAAGHRDTQAALGRVRDTVARLRREKTAVSVAAVARRASFSELRIPLRPCGFRLLCVWQAEVDGGVG
jgi:hypothetical protein